MELGTREAPSLILDVIETPESLAKLERLLNQAFPVPQGASYFDDFPVWRLAPEPCCRMCVWDRGALASSAAARIAKLRVGPERQVPVAVIGAVATDPAWRGKGLASRCVRIAVEWAIGQGAQAALLWSSEATMYQRLGFEPAGKQVLVPLEQLSLGSEAGQKVSTGWVPGLFDLIRSRKEGLVLSEADRSWFEAHRNVEWLWMGAAERPAAFVAVGKGIDLAGIVHEWGGDPAAVRSILGMLGQSRPDLKVLGSPEGIVEAGFLSSDPVSDPMCLGLPLTPEGEAWLQEGRFWLWGLDGA